MVGAASTIGMTARPRESVNMFSVNLRIPGPNPVVIRLRRGEAKTMLIPPLSKEGQNVAVIAFIGKTIGDELTLHGLRVPVL
ncbi:hypothetical protein ACNKHS_20965 [Shigella flexneri]